MLILTRTPQMLQRTLRKDSPHKREIVQYGTVEEKQNKAADMVAHGFILVADGANPEDPRAAGPFSMVFVRRH